MININFEHLEDLIQLENTQCNILVVENNSIYAKIMYSLYDTEDNYFKIFNEDFKIITDIITIFNPLLFDFNDRNMKSLLYEKLLGDLNKEVQIKHAIEQKYTFLVNQLTEFFEQNNDLNLKYSDEINYKDFLKFTGVSINQTEFTSIFERVQNIIHYLTELGNRKLVIFTHLNLFLTAEEYGYVVEQINLNNQTVLLIENSCHNLTRIPYYVLDSDFFLSENMV